MRRLEARFPGRVSVRIGYDEAYSHRLFAAGDAVLVPSRFEPCGLTQMYGLAYGTVPLVSAVGGLGRYGDSCQPGGADGGGGDGDRVSSGGCDGLWAGVARSCCSFTATNRAWTQVQKNAMKQPVGWEASAAAYAALYEDMLA